MKTWIFSLIACIGLLPAAAQTTTGGGCTNIQQGPVKHGYVWNFGENVEFRWQSTGGGWLLQPYQHASGLDYHYEGCTSYSTKDGLEMLASDGQEANYFNYFTPGWTQIVNGDSLHGHQSSTQSGLIVPNPGNQGLVSDTHYLFTVDRYYHYATNPHNMPASASQERGVNVTNITGSLSSGPPPFAINPAQKNLAIDTNTRSEKINATYDCVGDRYWVLTFHSQPCGTQGDFRAYEVTSSGINTLPVISPVNPAAPELSCTRYGTQSWKITEGDLGQLKFNVDGDMVAAAFWNRRILFLADFDKTTGQLTNQYWHVMNNTNYPGMDGNPYGIEFSGDGNYLYFTYLGTGPANTTATPQIMRWDVADFKATSGGTSANWPYQLSINSTLPINPFFRSEYASLQIGVDKKIYCAHAHPTKTGTAAYEADEVLVIDYPEDPLNVNAFANLHSVNPGNNGYNGYSKRGLPNYIQSNFGFTADPVMDFKCNQGLLHAALPFSSSSWNVTWEVYFGDTAWGIPMLTQSYVGSTNNYPFTYNYTPGTHTGPYMPGHPRHIHPGFNHGYFTIRVVVQVGGCCFEYTKTYNENCDSDKATLGLDENAAPTLQVAPNPTSGMVQIQFNQPVDGELRLLDLAGTELLIQSLDHIENTVLHLEELPAGIYLLQANLNGRKQLYRISKQ